jgi:hypothetical protein
MFQHCEFLLCSFTYKLLRQLLTCTTHPVRRVPYRPTSAKHIQQNTSLAALQQQWEAEGKHAWALKEPERIFEMLRDLVDFQVEVQCCFCC